MSLFDLTLLPVAGPLRAFVWMLEQIYEAADRELHDRQVLERKLMEARLMVELGEMSETEYAGVEKAIADRLEALRTQEGG